MSNIVVCYPVQPRHQLHPLTLAFSAVYYMTNYTPKYEISQYQLILTTVILKRSLEDAKAAAEPSETQLRIRRHGMDRFGLQRERCPCRTTFKMLLETLSFFANVNRMLMNKHVQ